MRKLLFLVLAIILSVSCEKDSPNGSNETNYYPLEIGNHWIYRHFEIHPEGGEMAMFNFDSIFIDQDSVFNGNQYFVLKKVRYSTYGEDPEGFRDIDTDEQIEVIEMLRDSSGYIVNEKGQIRFAENNFTDTLAFQSEKHDDVLHYTMTMKMEKPEGPITVPLGTFDALNYQGTVHLYYKEGNIVEIIENYLDCYYSNNIGKILDTYLLYSRPGVKYEKRLLRYHVGSDI